MTHLQIAIITKKKSNQKFQNIHAVRIHNLRNKKDDEHHTPAGRIHGKIIGLDHGWLGPARLVPITEITGVKLVSGGSGDPPNYVGGKLLL